MRSRSRGGAGPRRMLWTSGDLLSWTVLSVIGAVLMVAGWYTASGEADFADQSVPVNLGVGGLIVAGAANVSWLLAGRRAVGERRRLLLGSGIAAPVVVAIDADDADGVFVAGPSTRRFHRPSCPLAAGRDWPAASHDEHVGAGRSACGVCRPGV